MKRSCLRPCDTASSSHPRTSAPRSNVLFAQSATTHDLALQAALFTFRCVTHEHGEQLPKCAKLVKKADGTHGAGATDSPTAKNICANARRTPVDRLLQRSTARVTQPQRGGGGEPAFINNENKANFSVNTAGIVTYAQETLFTGL